MNELVHLQEFNTILNNYQFSDNAIKTLNSTNLVLLTAATATGRNTIINQLLRTNEYHYIISDTTRKPRANNGVMEQNGREYWFRSEEEVLNDLQAGEFLEAEVIHNQQVSGISIRELMTANASNKIAITDVDLGGILNITKVKPNTKAILILPPSFEEWQRRLKGRGIMPDEEYYRRLETATRIFESCLKNKIFNIIINDDIENAVMSVHKLATKGQEDEQELNRGIKLAEQLLVQTRLLLQQL